MKTAFEPHDVTIRDTAPVRVAVFEHRGEPDRVEATIQRFVAWRQAAGLPPHVHPTFNIWRSERRPANPADYSMDICVGLGPRTVFPDTEHEVKVGEIPGGRCAVLRVEGDHPDLEPAALFLYRDWLPASGEETRDFPIYCRRFLAEEGQPAAELFLPLR